uniref:poly(A)-specific ribonuclease n=1 Tax=Leersia perrieri TaxID=77586 RepID=A0A0D9WLK6_9ORYZ
MPPFPGDLGPVMLSPPPQFLLPTIFQPPPLYGHSYYGDHLMFSPAPETEVRDVWAANLEEETRNIRTMLPHYPIVSIDTEFPGTIHDGATTTPRHLRTPEQNYAVVKQNADELRLLQLGITLSDPAGDRCSVTWQFNFAGFDPRHHPHSAASIAMLTSHGIDFPSLRLHGVDPVDFAAAFRCSGLACRRLTWAAFSGGYDFAYLAKVLTGGKPLPEKLDGFLDLVGEIFGPAVLDVKHLARFCGDGGGIRGGLERVAAALGVRRAAGRAHNAGSDSLLTSDVLHAMVDRFFSNSDVLNHAGAIDGLVQYRDSANYANYCTNM